MRPVIGIVPLYDETNGSYWMLPGYMQALERGLATPVMLPLTTDKEALLYFIRTCDGLLFPGGQDVDPALYGEAPLPACGAPCRERDAMEKILFDAALQLDKPVLGICRGIQLMNVLTGGTLYQDLPSQRPTGVEHHMTPPYDRAVHTVRIDRESPLYPIIGQEEYAVNSYHHQAIKELSPKFRAAAVSEDGLVEGIWMPGKRFIVAVQWHPECSFLVDPAAQRLFDAFVKAAKYQ